MKKLFVTLTLVLFAFILSPAQTFNEEHFKVMGVSMGLPMDKFVKELKEKGLKDGSYSQTGVAMDSPNTDKNNIFLYGNFAGHKATFLVCSIDGSRSNYRVLVVLEYNKIKNIEILHNSFDILTESYTKKYGEPILYTRWPNKEEIKEYQYDISKYSDDPIYFQYATNAGDIIIRIMPAEFELEDYCAIAIRYSNPDDIEKTIDNIQDDI